MEFDGEFSMEIHGIPWRFSHGKGRRAPWYRLSLDHFQKLKQMLVPDWGQKCFLFLCPNRELHILSSFRVLVHDCYCHGHTCPVRSPRLCVQGKLSYLLIFPNQKRRSYRWLGKTCRMLSAATFQFFTVKLSSRLFLSTRLTAPGVWGWWRRRPKETIK